MTNKQKAWRSAGKGRKAKINHVKLLPTPSFLFMGLMMKAGLYDPLPPVDRLPLPPSSAMRQSGKSWLTRAWARAKGLFA